MCICLINEVFKMLYSLFHQDDSQVWTSDEWQDMSKFDENDLMQFGLSRQEAVSYFDKLVDRYGYDKASRMLKKGY